MPNQENQIKEIDWLKQPEYRQVITKKELLVDIKANIKSLLSDYKGRGIENEDMLIAEVQTMFTGGVVPSLVDWKILNLVLYELSEVKEQGTMYKYFIKDVSSSLGVNDLIKIRNFIEYIAKLPPIAPDVDVQIEDFPKYKIVNTFAKFKNNHQVPNRYNNATINWEVEQPKKVPNLEITIKDSPSEDIQYYSVVVRAGNYREEVILDGIKMGATKVKKVKLPVRYKEWFKGSIKNLSFYIEVTAIDKRGNKNSFKETYIYPPKRGIPQGFSKYEVKYQPTETRSWEDTFGYKEYLLDKAETRKHGPVELVEINGNHRFKVRGYDIGSGWSEWVESPKYNLIFMGEPPEAPQPKIIKEEEHSITFNWKPTKNTDYYIYTYNKIGSKQSKEVRVEKNETLSKKITNLIENTKYTITVRSCSKYYPEGSKGIVNAKTLDVRPGRPVPQVYLTLGDKIFFRWQLTENTDYYTYTIKPKNGEMTKPTRVTKFELPYVELTNLEELTEYEIYLRSHNEYYPKGVLGSTSAKTEVLVRMPEVPNPKIIKTDVNSLTTEWVPTDNTDYYTIKSINKKGVEGKSNVVHISKNNLNYTVDSLVHNSEYTIEVRAHNTFYPDGVPGTVLGKTLNDTPGTPEPIITKTEEHRIEFKWKPTIRTDYYTVSIEGPGRRSSDSWRIETTEALESYFASQLIDGTEYKIIVRAHNNTFPEGIPGEVFTRTKKIYPLPGKPQPVITNYTTTRADFKWAPTENTEYYKIQYRQWHHDYEREWRIETSSKPNSYFGSFKEYTWYQIWVGSFNQWYPKGVWGSIWIRTKQKVNKTKTYSALRYATYNEQSYMPNNKPGYYRPGSWGGIRNARGVDKPHWKSNSGSLYQGHWRETNWGWRKDGRGFGKNYWYFQPRSGGYWASDGQSHGNNSTMIEIDYKQMRKDLQNATVNSVSISLKREGTTHGWSSAKPLYLYTHNEDWANWNHLNIYDWHMKKISRNNNPSTSSSSFSRGGYAEINNWKTRWMVWNIQHGHMKGFAFMRYYRDGFHGTVWRGAKDYMRLDPNHFKVTVNYTDIV